jgi:hypothetical protein
MEKPMPFDRCPRGAVSCLVAALLVLACGRRDAANDEADPSADTGAPAVDTSAPASPAASDVTSAPLTTADIDRWAKGMVGELEAVKAAAAKLKSATSSEDTLSAMMGVQETATLEAGARAAGVDRERYNVIRSNLSAATAYLAPEVGGIDTTMLSPAQRTEMRQMNEAQLKQMEASVPADVVAALRPRAAELRKQDLALVAERLKGAGA